MERVVSNYLAYLNIPISRDYFEKLVASHPDYPSILSISDVLQRLGIEHQVGKIDKEHLGDVSFPYMLHSTKRNGMFQLIKERDDLAEHEEDIENENVILKAESTQKIADEENNEQLAKEKVIRKTSIALAAVLVGLFFIPLLTAFSWIQLVLLITAVCGVIVSYLLLAKDLGITYDRVEKFCNAGKRTNCDRILNAEDATLFGFLTFSDAAAGYFAFQLITIGLFVPLFQETASFLGILSVAGIAAIPVIFYSLYYQYIKAKTWCRLCVIVDVVLSIQAILFISMYYNQFFELADFSLVPPSISILLFTALTSSVVLLKKRLEEANTSRREEAAAKRIKNDPEIFTQLLLKEEKTDITPFEQEITIGDAKALVRVMMIVNLHCNPCSIAFNTIRQILASYPAKVCFSIRFTKGMDNSIGSLSASTYLIRYWQQFIYGSEDEAEGTKNLIEDWYNQMDPDAFLKQYPLENGMEMDLENKYQKLDDWHYAWVKQHKIVSTPTFFINGYKMPRSYRIKDLMAFMPGLTALWKKREEVAKNDAEEFA